MLGWWLGLPPLLRRTVAVLLIVLGIVLFWIPSEHSLRRRGSSLAFVGVGIVLLCYGGPSDPEKRGYKF